MPFNSSTRKVYFVFVRSLTAGLSVAQETVTSKYGNQPQAALLQLSMVMWNQYRFIFFLRSHPRNIDQCVPIELNTPPPYFSSFLNMKALGILSNNNLVSASADASIKVWDMSVFSCLVRVMKITSYINESHLTLFTFFPFLEHTSRTHQWYSCSLCVERKLYC